jgi:hypothetical protein
MHRVRGVLNTGYRSNSDAYSMPHSFSSTLSEVLIFCFLSVGMRVSIEMPSVLSTSLFSCALAQACALGLSCKGLVCPREGTGKLQPPILTQTGPSESICVVSSGRHSTILQPSRNILDSAKASAPLSADGGLDHLGAVLQTQVYLLLHVSAVLQQSALGGGRCCPAAGTTVRSALSAEAPNYL